MPMRRRPRRSISSTVIRFLLRSSRTRRNARGPRTLTAVRRATDSKPIEWLGGHVGRGEKPWRLGPLLANIIDELDTRVGSKFLEESSVGGIVGVENDRITGVC